ncbi:DUF2523 domain-containing protein [Ralstonia solanacearum]|uniref:DUF2523 domain-containing protein n=1 Tax=Ralstonia solanacearum TaxID=305 RepID=UPI000BD951E6|nr:DUF2523 domain-containing protein [Ralstonia solanacearum]ATJ85796.1 DUF2523 domain-containing protein [Ralstonia solanacearum]MCL9844602.1 DUF2523 domain-containing protein [Ralstonia solanacearum]MCL9850285.1 DUF2523 domain-containing protein [Ralstonia solanacearum]MCL9857443.1 DUF2523 domain-containing protein [Ralstonia solanacearum]MCL9864897.1 DUF2523 domain-containing protein [Ralstonia solanacearum]
MFDAVINALSALAQWLDSVFVAIFTALWQITEDLFIDSLDLLLQGVTAVLNTLPAPTFLSGVSLQAAFSSLGGDILFFFGVFNIGQGIGLLGGAFAFRMARKVVTLFQW